MGYLKLLDWFGLSTEHGVAPRRALWRCASLVLLTIGGLEFGQALIRNRPETLPSRLLFRAELYSRSQRELPAWARAAHLETCSRKTRAEAR